MLSPGDAAEVSLSDMYPVDDPGMGGSVGDALYRDKSPPLPTSARSSVGRPRSTGRSGNIGRTGSAFAAATAAANAAAAAMPGVARYGADARRPSPRTHVQSSRSTGSLNGNSSSSAGGYGAPPGGAWWQQPRRGGPPGAAPGGGAEDPTLGEQLGPGRSRTPQSSAALLPPQRGAPGVAARSPSPPAVRGGFGGSSSRKVRQDSPSPSPLTPGRGRGGPASTGTARRISPARTRGLGGSATTPRQPPSAAVALARLMADLEGWAEEAERGARQGAETVRDRMWRLEQEVAELRAQTARRLDANALEVAVNRAEADNAREEIVVLRHEVADLQARMAHLCSSGSRQSSFAPPPLPPARGSSTSSAAATPGAPTPATTPVNASPPPAAVAALQCGQVAHTVAPGSAGGSVTTIPAGVSTTVSPAASPALGPASAPTTVVMPFAAGPQIASAALVAPAVAAAPTQIGYGGTMVSVPAMLQEPAAVPCRQEFVAR